MDLGIRGKTAMVAAASSGLGRATAMALAAEGAQVAICSRSPERAELAATEIREATGARVEAFAADLGSPDGPASFVAAATEALGPISILVTNNGGPPTGGALDHDDSAWHSALEGTFLAATRLVRGVLPGMRQAGWGRIVHISSVSVKQPLDNMAASNASRAALAAWSKTLSREVAGEGITVNTVCPGPFATERSEQILAAFAEREGLSIEEARRKWAVRTPTGRLGDPSELGAVIAFLCSEQAAFVTGTALPVDGGATLSAT